MSIAPIPAQEARRLAHLRGMGLLDTAADPTLDDLARLAAAVTRSPVAFVSLID